MYKIAVKIDFEKYFIKFYKHTFIPVNIINCAAHAHYDAYVII